jgi:hypothetical protein
MVESAVWGSGIGGVRMGAVALGLDTTAATVAGAAVTADGRAGSGGDVCVGVLGGPPAAGGVTFSMRSMSRA